MPFPLPETEEYRVEGVVEPDVILNGVPLYIVDTEKLASSVGMQAWLRSAWGLEPWSSVPDSEHLMYFRPAEDGPTVSVPAVEWEALKQRVDRLELDRGPLQIDGHPPAPIADAMARVGKSRGKRK